MQRIEFLQSNEQKGKQAVVAYLERVRMHDGRPCAFQSLSERIDNNDADAVRGKADGRRKACWTCTDDEDVRIPWQLVLTSSCGHGASVAGLWGCIARVG